MKMIRKPKSFFDLSYIFWNLRSPKRRIKRSRLRNLITFSHFNVQRVREKGVTYPRKFIWFRLRFPWTKPVESGVNWWDITILNYQINLGVWYFQLN